MCPTFEVAARAWSLPLLLRSPCAARTQPVTRGFPLPRGLLDRHDAVTLADGTGGAIPLQTEALARWSDGSVRWLRLDFLIPEVGAAEEHWTLQPGACDSGGETRGVRVSETDEAVVVRTGTTEFHVDRRTLKPFAGVLLDGAPIAGFGSAVELTAARGHHLPRIQAVAVEATGPVRATVRLAGTFTGRSGLRFLARLCFFAGTGLVRLRLTIHNPHRARHRGGLWDLGDPGSRLFRELAVRFVLGTAAPLMRWTAEPGGAVASLVGETLDIYQDSSGGDNWQSRNHVNRNGRVPCSFRGYRVRAGGKEAAGLRANPVVVLRGQDVALAAALPEFWQQFPKGIHVEGTEIALQLFPGQFGDAFELQGGEQKTHTVWLRFGSADETDPDVLAWVHQPAAVQAPPRWYADSGAIPHLPGPDGDATAQLDELLGEAVSGPGSLFARREVSDEYGWRHYGDLYADHEAAHYTGPAPIISHYNNQYDVIYGAFLQYYRTGDRRWADLLEPLARHVIDIDVYHTTEDRAAFSGGPFWHTDHYRDAATGTHRGYSRANAPPGRDYGGGPGSEHNYTDGLLHYYYLTGDPQAREAVLGLADWTLRMDDGRLNLLGIVDNGPTGLASATRHPGYHGPGRGAGNSVNTLLNAWLLSGGGASGRCREPSGTGVAQAADAIPCTNRQAVGASGPARLAGPTFNTLSAPSRYLEKAEELIRRGIHPDDDVEARGLLRLEDRWSYTVFLVVLARYLDLKAEAGSLDFMYAYARASLLHYASRMVEKERPYFDQSGQLEYPTETWAAQELRKANAFRLAARYADEPLRARLLGKGGEFARRAWADLGRFASRRTARPLAVMMTEGTRDAFFRQGGERPAPPLNASYPFGSPTAFVPQKQRVLRRLKSVRGLCGLLLRLLDVRNWLRRPPRDGT
jgi:hypothetical protein